jgi:hypothetical protein
MAEPSIPNAADYADALLTTRRAKNWLTGLLILIVLFQVILFLLVRFELIERMLWPAGSTPTTSPTTLPTSQPVQEAYSVLNSSTPMAVRIRHGLQSGLLISNLLAVLFSVALVGVLIITVNILLIGRLIGVAPVTSSLVWSVVLAAMLFPWQVILNGAPLAGALYTWRELLEHGRFATDQFPQAVLWWGRFGAYPVIALIVLFVVQGRSKRGLASALGEQEAVF